MPVETRSKTSNPLRRDLNIIHLKSIHYFDEFLSARIQQLKVEFVFMILHLCSVSQRNWHNSLVWHTYPSLWLSTEPYGQNLANVQSLLLLAPQCPPLKSLSSN